jgi:site-specific recombinase XerC
MSRADFGCGRSLRELGLLRSSAYAATSRFAACCQHLAKVYDAAHPRAKKK